MFRIIAIFRLLRIKQWIKNFLIFTAPLGAGINPSYSALKTGLLGFIAISMSASTVYIINDYQDRHIDRLHPQKSKRPIASGTVSQKIAIPLSVCLFGSALICLRGFKSEVMLTICCYLFINLLYTFGLKRIPALELGIVSAGYSLRVLYGAQIFCLVASSWLMISTFSAAFGILAAKRKSELSDISRSGTSKRQVLARYTSSSLQNISTLAFGTAFTTYSLWLFGHPVNLQILPLLCEILALVIFALLIIESDKAKLESPENLVNSPLFMSFFSVFVILNLVLLYL